MGVVGGEGVSPPMAATQDSHCGWGWTPPFSEEVGWKTGLDSGLSWGLKDDQQEARETPHKHTAHKKGNKAVSGKRPIKKEISPSAPDTGPSKGLDPGPKPESPPPSWLQPGQHSSLRSISLHQG